MHSSLRMAQQKFASRLNSGGKKKIHILECEELMFSARDELTV